jgi:hypothetical protein
VIRVANFSTNTVLLNARNEERHSTVRGMQPRSFCSFGDVACNPICNPELHGGRLKAIAFPTTETSVSG